MKSLLLFVALAAPCAAAILEVQAGPHDRIQTVVTVPLPAEVPENPALKSAEGDSLPLQISDEGTATFILPRLVAGETTTFDLISLPTAAAETVTAQEKENKVEFAHRGKSVTTFQGKATAPPREEIEPIYLRGGYLHPLLTPTGNVVTDDYPHNHLHHHGIWTAWTHALFQGRETDFWNMGQGRGKVDCKSIDHSWSGPVHAGVEAQNEFVDLSSGEPIVALNERWTVKVFAIDDEAKPYHLVELVSEQTMAGDHDLTLPKHHYGGIGIRGLGAWDGKPNADFLTSEGLTDREAANSKPAKWIAMSGPAAEGKAGIAILGHPENFRAPQPLRVHPAEPFISFAPQIAGPMRIDHGKSYRSAYRFVLSDGAPDEVFLERLWNDYAEPPVTRWR